MKTNQTESTELDQQFEKVFVLDTNVILSDAQRMLSMSQEQSNLIVLPETVIDELDSKKSGFDEVNFQAREFGRLLDEAELVKTTSEENATIVRIKVRNCLVDIVSLVEYGCADADKSIVNDRKIIGVAQFAKLHYQAPCTLVSNDVMCRTRAISLGVNAEGTTRGDIAAPVFIKEMYVDSVTNHSDVFELDPQHQPDNYCYHLKLPSGREEFAWIVDGRINLIDPDNLQCGNLRPKNVGQMFAMAGMLDERIDICVIEALAGSGKTLLSLAAGIRQVKEGKYDRIVYIRNSVESVDKAEEVGFLPGLEEKFKIYNYPLYDSLNFISQLDVYRWGSQRAEEPSEDVDEKIKKLMKKYHIETMWNGAIRGRTIQKAYVIIDEVQNFSKSSLQTVMTRIDKDSKVVCIGSNRQIDHPYINKHSNGLSVLLSACTRTHDKVRLFGTELTKVVRGRITEWAEKVFEDNK